MSYIAGLKLRNWMRFRGEHAITLGPGAWSIEARWEGDPTRSNWGGKSALLSAIAFAATGYNPKRTLDELVSRGESEAMVELTMSDGAVISCAINGGTELVVQRGGKVAKGKAALTLLADEVVGFAKDDFLAGPWVRQKHLDDLVTIGEADRMGLVGSWLSLGGLEKAEAAAAQDATRQQKQLRDAAARLAYVDEQLAGARPRKEAAFKADAMGEAAETLFAEVARLDAEVARQAEAARALAELDAAEARYEQITARGLEAKTRAEELEAPTAEEMAALEREVSEVLADEQVARQAAESAAALCSGAFDGACPVNGRACPVRDEINADQEAASARNAAAQAALKTAAERARIATASRRVARDLLRKAEQAGAELERLRAEAVEVGERVDALEEQAPPRGGADYASLCGRRDQARQEAENVREGQRAALRAMAEHDRLTAERAKLAAEVEALTAAVSVARRAAQLLGRGGAQRLVAERGLALVEAGANELLGGAGIDLVTQVRWRREARGLEPQCSACGQAYPRGTRTKHCEACGTKRGPNYTERLDIVPSDESGAALDLAGLAVQLSAARWLRQKRRAPWGTLAVDEPFGACDEANRSALARALGGLLAGSGFEQLLVVSHDRQTQEALPGRVVVVAGPEWSRLEVE